MGGLRTFTVALGLGAVGVATLAAAPARSQPPPPPANPAKPPTPSEMLRTGARLYNKGLIRWASKYFDAAEAGRRHLTPSERIVLDTYQKEIDDYSRRLRASLDQAKHNPREDTSVVRASTKAAEPADWGRTKAAPADGGREAVKSAKPEPATAARLRAAASAESAHFATTDAKQKGRWALQSARAEIARGHFDEAARLVETVRAMNIKWGFWDDTPDKVAKAIAEFRAKAPAMAAAASEAPKAAAPDHSPTARPLGIRLAPSPAK